MPVEVAALGWALVVAFGQFVLMAIVVNLRIGPGYTAGPRDERREIPGVAGRLHRALTNMFEALVLFTGAVVLVTLGEASSALTQDCARVFVFARLAYVPAYASGIWGLRSAVWAVGFGATAIMVFAALL